MATYRELHGKAVKTVTTNPTDTAAEGQIWFNSTDNTFKSAILSEAWHSSGARVTNSIPAGQGGTQNAAWFCGGTLDGSGPGTNTEEYDGSGWSTGGTMSTARRYGQGWGTQTAAITASGSPMTPPNSGMTATEEYNGTAWTAGTAVPSPYVRYNGAGMGAVQTAGAIFCGSQNPPDLNTTLEWDGSSWTGGGNYPFSGPIGTGSAGGTLTAGIAMGGPSQGNVVCKYDGSSWTTTTNYPDSKSRIGVAGTQTAAIGFGGQNSSGTTTNAFLFDGSTFTATGSLGVTNSSGSGHYGMGGSSPSTTTVGMFQGDSATEEFNQSATIITGAAWASAANMGTARASSGGTGTPTAAMCISGRQSGSSPDADITNAETFDGTSWTAISPVLKSRYNAKACGPNGAVAWVGGNSDVSPDSGNQNKTEEWNGTSWTQGGTLSRSSERLGVFGVQTSCVACGGSDSPYPNFSNRTDEYNGTAWTAYPTYTISANIGGMAGSGTETAGVISGGSSNTVPSVLTTQEYNGSAWTTVNNAVHATSDAAYGSVGSSQTSTFSICGNPAGTASMHYDGTNWSTAPNTALGANSVAGAGTVAEGVVFGGQISGSATRYANTEIFNQDTTSLNVKTLTQS